MKTRAGTGTPSGKVGVKAEVYRLGRGWLSSRQIHMQHCILNLLQLAYRTILVEIVAVLVNGVNIHAYATVNAKQLTVLEHWTADAPQNSLQLF